MCVKYGFLAGALFSVHLLNCLPVTPALPQKLDKPALRFSGMAVVQDPLEGYREAVHLSWTLPNAGNTPVRSFTLLRRVSTDSFFDVFSGSRLIPADTCNFYDQLADHAFPINGFDSIFYCLCAVDSFGRTGDTSEACMVILAPQARFVNYDTVRGCFEWESWIRGGIFSWCSVWRGNDQRQWTFTPPVAFPQTDQPGRFFACFPDSLQPPPPGRWYYALFIRANESHSLKIGSIDVR